MDELADGRRTWKDLCRNEVPRVGPNGVLIGPWGDAIAAAVRCEQTGQMFRFADGPAGQVLAYLQNKGHGKYMKAADATEAAAKNVCRPSAPPGRDTRPVCKYGPSCYRKNPDHLKEFAHPWLEGGSAGGYTGAGASPSAGPGGGYPKGKGGGKGGGKSAGGAPVVTTQVRCYSCGSVFVCGVPPGTASGAKIQVGCPTCSAVNECRAPAGADAAPVAAAHVGGPPPKVSGRQRAVLIGINYFGTRAQLRGCINDVKNMHRLLTETFGWNSRDIRTLTDDDPKNLPTRANIERAMHWLADGARTGDVLFFHFSGHGAQKEDPHGYEEDGMNETILPLDFERAGQMSDDEIGDILVKPLREGVKLVSVMDCCHSGTGLDLPFCWTGRQWREETNPYHSLGDVQMFSGCEDDDTSSDASTAYGAAGGAMTTAFCDVLRSNPCPTYPQLMSQLHGSLRRRGFSQRPQLTSSQRFDIDRPFILSDILPNMNAQTGRIFRRKFPPRPRPMQGPLADMLGLGVAVLGGMVMGDIIGDLLFGL